MSVRHGRGREKRREKEKKKHLFTVHPTQYYQLPTRLPITRAISHLRHDYHIS